MKKILLSVLVGSSLLMGGEVTKTVTVPSGSGNINVNVKMPKSKTQNRRVAVMPNIIENTPVINHCNSIINISGTGIGVPPANAISPAQAKYLARRAAIADAYRSLAEKMYGIRLSAKDRVRDLVTQRTEVRTAVYGLIRGAKIDEEIWKDGAYRVVLLVKLDTCRWNRYLTAPSLYCGGCAR